MLQGMFDFLKRRELLYLFKQRLRIIKKFDKDRDTYVEKCVNQEHKEETKDKGKKDDSQDEIIEELQKEVENEVKE